jgi:hypothetical protein
MGKYEILKLRDESFDFLVIATSYENPLSYINDIKMSLNVSEGNILFDLTLINGVKKNRYVACNFSDKTKRRCSLVAEINDCIKHISRDYFIKNDALVRHSILPKALKFLVLAGKV